MTNVQQPGDDQARIPADAAIPGTSIPQTDGPMGSAAGSATGAPGGAAGSPTRATTGGTGTPGGAGYSGAGTGSTGSTSDTAKEEAAHVADTAKDAGRRVTDTAKEEVHNVATEAKAQGKRLLDETMHEASAQAKTQQHRAAEGLHTFGSDLRDMASGTGSPQSGFASQFIGEAGERIDAAGRWLEDRDPADLLDEAKRFARQRPGLFIALAGVAGLVVGRLTSGMISQAKEEHERTARASGTPGAYGSTTPRHSASTGATGTDWSGTTGSMPPGTTATGSGTVTPTDPSLRAQSSDASATDGLVSDAELRRRAGL